MSGSMNKIDTIKIAPGLENSNAPFTIRAADVFKDVNSLDKSLMEKVSLIDSLDKKEKAAFYAILDALLTKKKMKDNLSSVLQGM